MKGYFQRLAASVLNPRSAVHPLSGSVFTRHTTDAAISAATPVAAPATVNPLNPSRTIEAGPLSGPTAWREETPASSGMPGSFEQTSAELEPREKRESSGVARFQPLVSPALMELVPVVEKGSSTPGVRQKPKLSTAVEPRHASGVEERVQLPEPQQSPIVNRQVPFTAVLPRETPRSSPGPGRGAVGNLTRAVTVPPREQDIEIHIGRIEVLAVPPVVRPAPPPVRKGLNLSEYLQRSDARTR